MNKTAMLVCNGCGKLRGFIDATYLTEQDEIDITAKVKCIGCIRTNNDKVWNKFAN